MCVLWRSISAFVSDKELISNKQSNTAFSTLMSQASSQLPFPEVTVRVEVLQKYLAEA